MSIVLCSWKFSLLCRIRQAVKAVSARLHNWVWQSVNTNLHGISWYENMLEEIFHATVLLWDFHLQRWRLAEHMAWRFSACRENHQNLETLVSFQGEIYVTIGFFFYFNLHHLNHLLAPRTPKTKFHIAFPAGLFEPPNFWLPYCTYITNDDSYEGNLWNQIFSPTVSNLMPVWLPPTLQPGDRTLQLRDHDQHHHPVPCHGGWWYEMNPWMVQMEGSMNDPMKRSIWISAKWKLPFLNG